MANSGGTTILIKRPINLLSLSYSDANGGAARAVYRIHQSMVCNESQLQINAKLLVREKLTEDNTVVEYRNRNFIVRRKLGSGLASILKVGFSSENYNLRTLAWPSTGIAKKLNADFKRGLVDLVQLNWLGFGTISIEEIGSLRMPLVWCLQDQWPFLGSEHYEMPMHPKRNELHYEPRYLSGYTRDNRPPCEKGLDLDKWTWQRKKKTWKKKIHLIVPSRWMAECVQKSKLMESWPVSIIPAPIDTDFWSPGNKQDARKKLDLPRDMRCILLTSEGGLSKPRKGGSQLLEALDEFNSSQVEKKNHVSLIVTGDKVANQNPSKLTEIIYMGQISDDLNLRTLYRAADIVAIPSLQDNFPNTGLEAQACGKPVIGFKVGGLPDLVADRETGVLVSPFDTKELRLGISWLLESTERFRDLESNARTRAINLWNPIKVATQFRAVYDTILS